jgi:diguanylate cyclase (GGDEF)-like protein
VIVVGSSVAPRAIRKLSWRIYPLLGAVVLACYRLLPHGVPRELAYALTGLSSVVAILVGIRWNRPARAGAWYLMAAGGLSWVLGDTALSWSARTTHAGSPPRMVDLFYLTAYPLLAAGLALLARGRRSSRDYGGLIDTAIVTVGLGLLTWIVLAEPTVENGHLGLGARLLGGAYPAADLLLVALLVRLLTGPGARMTAFKLLACAVVLLLGADVSSSLIYHVWGYSPSALDPLWLASYVLWGTAALHPTMRGLSSSAPLPSATLSNRRLAALVVAILIAPGTMAVELLLRMPIDGWAIVIGSMTLFALVVTRMDLSIRQLHRTTAQQRRLEHDLAYQAAHDPLTDLPNRAQTLELVEAALHRAQRSGAAIGLLIVDLDGFKSVNDDVGHLAGDVILQVTAQRMQSLVRAGDAVGRLGGDEFAVLVEPVENEAALAGLADRLIAAIWSPITPNEYPVVGRTVIVGANVGISVSRDGSTDAGELVREADTAVHRAKATGRGQAEIFDDVLRREVRDRAELEAAVSHGLASGEFALHYQPVVSVQTGRTAGYEALIRWNRPGHGMIPPDRFIPTVEKSALICDLGCWVLGEATRQLVEWIADGADLVHAADPTDPDAGVAPLTVAVNISGRHLASPHILRDVKAALAASGLDPRRLTLEITETVLVDDPIATHHLAALRRLGVTVSIDDFGTGYTSIGHLQNLPVDNLKIDKSFIDSSAPGARELVSLMVNAAHAFGLVVIAEGVERLDQLQALKEIGCDCVQGYLVSRPLTAEAAGERVLSLTA